MVICLERGADLHMAQLMPLPLTVSCFSKIQIGFTFLVPAHLGSPRNRAVKRVCVCVSVMHGQCDARPTVASPAAGHHHPLTGTKLYCSVTEARVCEQHLPKDVI